MSDEFNPNLLRIILAGVGVVVIIAIYLWSRGRRPTRGGVQFEEALPDGALENMEELAREIVEPDDETLAREAAAMGEAVASHRPEPAAARPKKRPEPARPAPKRGEKPKEEAPRRKAADEFADEKIVAIHVTAPKELRFSGEGIQRAVSEAGLVYGEFGIFHRLPQRDAERPLFSLANMVKPGSFDLGAMEEFTSPGLTLFMRIPNPVEPIQAFDEMYAAAKRIAEALHGEVRDQSRSMMSKQTAEHLREEIREFQLKRNLIARR